MGNSSSTEDLDIFANTVFLPKMRSSLKAFTGRVPVGQNCVEDFISKTSSIVDTDPMKLYLITRNTCHRLAQNNYASNNFSHLVSYTIDLMNKIINSLNGQTSEYDISSGDGSVKMDVTALTNSVVFARLFIQYIVENCLKEDATSLSVHFYSERMEQNILKFYVKALFKVVTEMPTNDFFYALHIEIVGLIIVLLSSEMYATPLMQVGSSSIGGKNTTPTSSARARNEVMDILYSLISDKKLSEVNIINTLLFRFVKNEIPPLAVRERFMKIIEDQGIKDGNSTTNASTSHLLTRGSSSDWDTLFSQLSKSILMLPLQFVAYFFSPSSTATFRSPLAHRSLLLLLLMLHNGPSLPQDGITTASTDSSSGMNVNIFKEYLKEMKDAADNTTTISPVTSDSLFPSTSAGVVSIDNHSPPAMIAFHKLYDILSTFIQSEAALSSRSPIGPLALYSLVNTNPTFAEYVLARSDVDTLMTPLLQLLYNSSHLSSDQLYILLILLLIFTQDPSFNEHAHRRVIIPSVDFYQERTLQEISLGSLMLITLLRTIQYNLIQRQDSYLFTNCFATLVNMASYCEHLHPYAAQKLVTLIALISKRKRRFKSRLSAGDSAIAISLNTATISSHSQGASASTDITNALHEISLSSSTTTTTTTTTNNNNNNNNSRDYDTSHFIASNAVSQPSNTDGSATTTASIVRDPRWDMIDTYSEFLRILLEIVKSCLTHSTSLNIELIYSCIHSYATFTRILDDASSDDNNNNKIIVKDILNILDYFKTAIETEKNKLVDTDGTDYSVNWDVEYVKSILSDAAHIWRNGNRDASLLSSNSNSTASKRNNNRRYVYEEETDSDMFFTPFIWELIYCNTSDLHWSEENILLFDPSSRGRAGACDGYNIPSDAYDGVGVHSSTDNENNI